VGSAVAADQPVATILPAGSGASVLVAVPESQALAVRVDQSVEMITLAGGTALSAQIVLSKQTLLEELLSLG
jgi:hypothetical protein